MTTVTRNQKIYFAAVGLFALWVGIWGGFIPEHVDEAIPWLVPPFHARFIGAIYLSAVVIMGGCMMAHRFAEVWVAVFMIGVWTGSLFVISLFHLNEFDFSRKQVWFWFGAYIIYPLIGFWLSWNHRTARDEPSGPKLPNWTQSYLFAQGFIITALALALLLESDLMVSVWPWKVTRFLIQIYSGPFLAYGLGSLLLSRQRTWPEVRIVMTGFIILTAGVLSASIIHHDLFTTTNLATWLWFGGFSLATLLLGVIILRSYTEDRK